MEWVDQLKPLIDWLHLHPGWAGVMTFFISLSESLAVLGLIIPGSVIMSAIGTLIGADIIPALATFIWGILGAFVGDIISYHLGFRFNERIPSLWPFSRYPHWLIKAQDFFSRHGSKSVFLGRFIGPMRPITPIVAGMMKMKLWRFYLTSFTASIFWAPLYMLPGILIGAASQQLAPATATRFLIATITTLTVFCLTLWLVKGLVVKLLNGSHKLIAYFWQSSQSRSSIKRLDSWLRDPHHPQSTRQINWALACVTVTFASLLGGTMLCHYPNLLQINSPIYNFIASLHQSLFTAFFLMVSLFSNATTLIIAWLAGALCLCFQRQWTILAHWLLGFLLILFWVGISHLFIYSPHPSAIILFGQGNAFPSIETALTVTLWGLLGVIAEDQITHPLHRKALYYGLSLTMGLLILARLYLGVHWLTDVIGGFLCGLWTLSLTTLLLRRYPRPLFKFTTFFLSVIVTLVLVWAVLMLQSYQKYNHYMRPFWPSYEQSTADWWSPKAETPPLYRNNRIGKPVHLINIQWLGHIETIEATLKAMGWHIQPKTNLISLINNLASHDKTSKSPVLPPLYLGHRPVLVAVKPLPGIKQTLLLQLWVSKITLKDSTLPLWSGSLEYQSTHPHEFWATHKQTKAFSTLPSPFTFFYPLPQTYQIKQLTYPVGDRLHSIPSYEWEAGVLLIKECPFTPQQMLNHAKEPAD